MIEIMAFIEAANKSGANHGAGEIAAIMSRICHRARSPSLPVTTSLCLGGLAAVARAARRRHLERAQAPGEVAGGRAEDRLEQSVGGGYAGITVADGRVYTLDLEAPIVPKAKGATDDGKPDGAERVLCFDAATGETLWSHKYPVKYGELGGYANGPRTSPTIHDGKVYTLGAVGHLFCFDAKTGKIIWQHDTVAEFGAQVPEWGFAGSPVIDGDRVIVHLGAKRRRLRDRVRPPHRQGEVAEPRRPGRVLHARRVRHARRPRARAVDAEAHPRARPRRPASRSGRCRTR